MPRFPYPPLLSAELRLLELHPGLPDDRLTGTVFHRILSPEDGELPDFEALSYCWGDQSRPEQVKLATERPTPGEQSDQSSDSGHVDIGPNLASALRALRYRDCKRVLWCDSICINQQDTVEREGQVQRMADVYMFAERVIAWLGPATPWASMAMETVRQVGNRHFPQEADTPWLYQNMTPHASAPTTNRSGIEITYGEPIPFSQDQWHSFEKLLDLNWHRRLWTHQEIVFANQETSIVRLGEEEMPWARYKDAVAFICTYPWGPLTAILLDPARCTRNEFVFVYKVAAIDCAVKQHASWIDALAFTEKYDCSDDRDRLYALRGLLQPDIARCIRVDYTKSAKEIAASACVTHLEQRRNLDFLRLCNSTTSPTWAVDLQKPLSVFEVSSDAGARSAASARLIKPGVLEVAGLTCDEITRKPIDLPGSKSFENIKEYLETLLMAFRDLTGNDDFHRDDKCVDELITAMTYGDLWDFSALRTESPPSGLRIALETGRLLVQHWVTAMANGEDSFHTMFHPRYYPATACTRTRNGTLACVPLESRSGDIIVTLLGLRCNLVLRPQPQDGSYEVVGPCYHPGFSDGQAVLGDDFCGWERGWCNKRHHLVFWKEGEPLRLRDPRLDRVPLPFGYSEYNPVVYHIDTVTWTHKDEHEEYMENERIYDPRMSEHRLKERGVPIERFRLI
ncbi:heterokaryon incompatibility protein het-6 [Fusarium pseudoanthophilum]|uniref:Heterokaryon incompatibility protein het-6 n=1 Tax=Fusarium pseudoanthophilum TaxID=48495 RepID=A0A8H5UUM7_9HYPO|nr:heterokaryon incompatibility protein het-6 [Fusarium pseudoanthophilum]